MVDDEKKFINADKDVIYNGSDYEGEDAGDDDDVDDKDNDCHHDQGKEDND
jgi:hypothetical protein